MARLSFFTHCLLSSCAAFLLASDSSLMKVPQGPRAAGVFMLIEGGRYTFNFTAARAACLFLNVTIATAAQVERALQHGLEMCKFGWTAEQIAVVPRRKADINCGRGNTGVVTWPAKADKEFGVFCFNASAPLEDSGETPNRSTASPHSSTFPTTPAALTPPSTSATPLPGSTIEPPPPTAKGPEQTSFTSALTTHSTRIPSTATLEPSSTHIPTSLSHLITSQRAVVTSAVSTSAVSTSAVSTSAVSTSVHASDFSVSSESVTPHLVSPAKPSLGDVPTALIVLGIILLLLAAAGVVWYHKLNIFTFWPQKDGDDAETEMWKHTDSDMDLHSQQEEEEEEEEEEEPDRKYSSDIMLCVNPHFKTNSSE